MLVKKSQKIPKIFECKKCYYNTCSKKDFKKHTETLKHNRLVNASNMLVEETKHNNTFVCCCGKSYCHESSYYRHKKKCYSVENKNIKNDTDEKEEMMNDKELIQYLMKENSEFKQLMLEQSKTMNELAKKAGNTTNK